MVRVKAFRAYRPKPDMAPSIASPPYDVLDSNEAREIYAQKGPTTFLRVNKPEIDLPESLSSYDIQVYEMGRTNLELFISNGWLVQDKLPGMYVYAQKMGDHMQYGLCTGVAVEDYALGLIKRHERTTVKKENDRTRLTYTQNANVGPVFLTYRDSEEVNEIISSIIRHSPETSFTADDGIEHFLWPVFEPGLLRHLTKAFEAVPCSYIADGHHRSASAFRVGEMKIKDAIARGETVTGEETFNYFLAVLFPSTHLKIMEYNRAIQGLNGFSEEEFLERVEVCFECRVVKDGERPEPPNKGEMGMCLRGVWYRLKAKPGTFNAEHPVDGLDVQVLYDNLLNPILNIGNPRTDERIKYVGGMRGPKELELLVSTRRKNGWDVAFCMYPVSIEEVMRISDADELMSPKATWFEPKLRSGLIVRLLDDAINAPSGSSSS